MANYQAWSVKNSPERRSSNAKKAAKTRMERYSKEERSEWAKKAADSRRLNDYRKAHFADVIALERKAEIVEAKVVGIVFMIGIGVPCLFVLVGIISILVGLVL